MAQEDVIKLTKALEAFPVDVRAKAQWMRKFVWNQYPRTNELIYDNYNALAVGWSITDRMSHLFCSFALTRTGNVQFCFFFFLDPCHRTVSLQIGRESCR